jgi:hypothetical protein
VTRHATEMCAWRIGNSHTVNRSITSRRHRMPQKLDRQAPMARFQQVLVLLAFDRRQLYGRQAAGRRGARSSPQLPQTVVSHSRSRCPSGSDQWTQVKLLKRAPLAFASVPCSQRSAFGNPRPLSSQEKKRSSLRDPAQLRCVGLHNSDGAPSPSATDHGQDHFGYPPPMAGDIDVEWKRLMRLC